MTSAARARVKAPNWTAATPEVDADPARWSWLHGDGCRTPYSGPAYPVCDHGVRATILDDPSQVGQYVGTPAERLERAQAVHAESYADCAHERDELRRWLDRVPTTPRAIQWEMEAAVDSWGRLVRLVPQLQLRAAASDRVEREVGHVAA